MIKIDMEWSDDGANIKTNIPFPCPACSAWVVGEHRCGDMLEEQPTPRKKRPVKRQPAPKTA